MKIFYRLLSKKTALKILIFRGDLQSTLDFRHDLTISERILFLVKYLPNWIIIDQLTSFLNHYYH